MGCATSTPVGKVDVATHDDETKDIQHDAPMKTCVEDPVETIEPPHLRERKPSSDAISKQGERIKWRKGDLIGSGANGRVYLGLEEDTGAIIAVKEIVFSDISPNREELEQMQEEIELLRTLRHPNIVAYLGTDVDDENRTLYIFTEWVPGGSIQVCDAVHYKVGKQHLKYAPAGFGHQVRTTARDNCPKICGTAPCWASIFAR